MAYVELKNLSAGYRRQAVVRNIDIELDAGIVALLAPNGCGKSTLLRVLAGVLPPLQGKITIAGYAPYQSRLAKECISYLPHVTALNPKLTAYENLRFWAGVCGDSWKTCQANLTPLISAYGLLEQINCPVSSLSRGTRQKVALMGCFMRRVDLYLLDEPTTGLDLTSQKVFRNCIFEKLQQGAIVLFATHNLYEAEELAKTFIILQNGKVTRVATGDSLRKILQSERVLIIVGHGDLQQYLSSCGYSCHLTTDGCVVNLSADQSIANVMTDLLHSSLTVKEIKEPRNSLTDFLVRALESRQS